MVRFAQGPRIGERARRRRAVLDRVDPLGVLAGAVGDEGLGRLEILELGFGQQHVLAVVGEQHALVTDEEHTAAPLADEGIVLPHVRFAAALVPVQRAGSHLPTRAGFITTAMAVIAQTSLILSPRCAGDTPKQPTLPRDLQIGLAATLALPSGEPA